LRADVMKMVRMDDDYAQASTRDARPMLVEVTARSAITAVAIAAFAAFTVGLAPSTVALLPTLVSKSSSLQRRPGALEMSPYWDSPWGLVAMIIIKLQCE
jgi:hypothetical protein